MKIKNLTKNLMKNLKSKILSIFMIIFLSIQVFDFFMDLCEGLNINLPLPPIAENISLLISVFLTFLLFEEFLSREFELNKYSISILIAIFFVSFLNVLLKFLTPKEFLISYKDILNLIPIMLIFLILPLYTYYSCKNLKKSFLLVIFAIVVVYPISQLYPLVMDKFIAVLSTFYMFYLIITSSNIEGINFKEIFNRALNFDEVIIDNLLFKPAEGNKLIYYLYFLLMFYMLSDFILYIIPSVTNLWTDSEYLAILNISQKRAHLTLGMALSILSFLYLITYPVLIKILPKRIKILNMFGVFSIIFFTLEPSITLSPIINKDGYGVILGILDSTIDKTSLFALIAIFVLTLLFYKTKAHTNILKDIIILFSLSIVIPYSLVYAYSIAIHSIVWYSASPYIVLAVILLGFLIYSVSIIFYNWISNTKISKLNFRNFIILFYISLTMLIYMPSIYTALQFAVISILFLLNEKEGILRIFERLIFVVYLTSILIFKSLYLYILFAVWMLYMILKIRGVIKSNIKFSKFNAITFVALSIIFILFGVFINEKIPFEKTLVGVGLLFLFSGAEEILMKHIIYNRLSTSFFDKFIVSFVFTISHLLNYSIFINYLPILPIYALYLFSYQLSSLYLYDKTKSLELMMLLHFTINLGILFLGN